MSTSKQKLHPDTQVRILKTGLIGSVVSGKPNGLGKIEVAFKPPWIGWYAMHEFELMQKPQ